jgi:acetyl-CoA acetyltransferase
LPGPSRSASLPPDRIEDVIFGCANQGPATMCIGVGQGIAMVVERV